MFKTSVTVSFSYSHRLMSVDGSKFYDKRKCGSNHGHEMSVRVVFKGKNLDEWGFLVDFGVAKRHLKNLVNDYFDHATLCHPKDENYQNFCNEEGDRIFIMPDGYTTSSELIAKFIYEKMKEIFSQLLYSIEVWETENNSATYYIENKEEE